MKTMDNSKGVSGVRVMHGRWSLHPHHGRRDSDGGPDRYHIPGRTAACQGRHRRGSHTGGPGRSPHSCWVGPWIETSRKIYKYYRNNSKNKPSLFIRCLVSEWVAVWTTLPWEKRRLTIAPETLCPPSTSNCPRKRRRMRSRRGGGKLSRSRCIIQWNFWGLLLKVITTAWMLKWYRVQKPTFSV